MKKLFFSHLGLIVIVFVLLTRFGEITADAALSDTLRDLGATITASIINELEVTIPLEEADEILSDLEKKLKKSPNRPLLLEKYLVAHFTLTMDYLEKENYEKAFFHSHRGIFAARKAIKIDPTSTKSLAIAGNLKCIQAALLQNSFLRAQNVTRCFRDLDMAVETATKNSKDSLKGDVQLLISHLLRGYNSALVPKSLKRAKSGVEDLTFVIEELGIVFELLPTNEKQRIYYNLALLYKNLSHFDVSLKMIDKVLEYSGDSVMTKSALKLMDEL